MSERFHNWPELQNWIEAKGLFHMELGLKRMKDALEAMNIKPLPIVQVLGTNGKGSTSVFLASLAQAHDLKCGLFISPHFISIKERILINGGQINDADWLKAANCLYETIDAGALTYFEFLTLLALWLFSNLGVKLAVFEAGLGGRNDATSALPILCHVFTSIAMDHAAIIGPKLSDIAKDKADAIQPASAVISIEQFPSVKAILVARCQMQQATLQFAQSSQFSNLANLRNAAAFQKKNASLALAAWKKLAFHLNIFPIRSLCLQALQDAKLPGRMQFAPSCADRPALILDGGHNPHAMLNLIDSLPLKPKTIIFSALKDKHWQAEASMLARAFQGIKFLCPQLQNERAENANHIADHIDNLPYKNTITILNIASLKSALCQAEGPVLVCGSLYLLAEVFKLYPQLLQNAKIIR